MEVLNIRNLNFKYSGADCDTLSDINMSVSRGEFVLVCGESGSGKSTLLKMIKTQIKPMGDERGEVKFLGQDIDSYSDKDKACRIGYVFQNPENQIVTDKVWHELAFGLENTGCSLFEMKKRIAEMAAFFGIDSWFERDTDTLSGGEKQKLNLASIVVMKPELLLLDEPVSQLDPIAAMEFIQILRRINREFGMTIIIAEHNIDGLVEMADTLYVMKEGKMADGGSVKDVLKRSWPLLSGNVPAYVSLHRNLGLNTDVPLCVRDMKLQLERHFDLQKIHKNTGITVQDNTDNGDIVIKADKIYFRYEKKSKDILYNISLNVKCGEIYSILGNNGSGKTTLLKVLAGIKKPYSGKVVIKSDRIAYMPQNPQTLFTKNTLVKELEDVCRDKDKIHNILKELKLSEYVGMHPYDLSGGQQQKAALAKLLLTEPEIILFDEPTKGLDMNSITGMGNIMVKLKKKGIAIVLVTHNIEFAARYSDRCGMIFDREITCEGRPHEFFGNNDFYTTGAHRIGREQFGNVIYEEEIVELCNMKED